MKPTRIALTLTLAAACGGSPNVQMTPPDGGAPDGAPPSSVTVTAITPADGATKVSAYAPITITLSGAADAASITSQSVKVFYGASKLAVAGAVAYDAATKTITFTPSLPLAAPNLQQLPPSFTVDVKGVTAGGAPVTEATSHFRIYASPTKTTSFYSGGKLHNLEQWEHDADGRLSGFTAYAAGADGKLGTADDVIKMYAVYDYSVAGHARENGFNDPGTDGKWKTADDVQAFSNDTTLVPGGDGDTIGYGDAGTDGKWGTSDDLVGNYIKQQYDDHDRLIFQLFGDPGDDGIMGNDDDNVTQVTVFAYTGDQVHPTTSTQMQSTGVDGKWGTADDVPATYVTAAFDDHGGVTSRTTYAVGADQKAGTADDSQQYVDVITLDAHHMPVDLTDYIGPGADNQWGTADDLQDSYDKTTYDANGVVSKDESFEVGPDGKRDTADDLPSSTTINDDSL